MLADKINEYVKNLKEENKDLVGVIVTDDTGLKIYPPKTSEALDTLGGALATLINNIKNNIERLGLDGLRLLTIRIENYIITIVPSTATITMIVRRKGK